MPASVTDSKSNVFRDFSKLPRFKSDLKILTFDEPDTYRITSRELSKIKERIDSVIRQ